MALDLAQMRREIEDNYKRDIQSIEWLMSRIGSEPRIAPPQTATHSYLYIAKQPQRPPELCPECRMIIRIMASAPTSKEWTVAELLKEMVALGHDIGNEKRPDARINVAINQMAEDGGVRVVRPAAGRRPKLFVYTGQPNIDFREDEKTKEPAEAGS